MTESLERAVGRIEGKIDQILEAQKGQQVTLQSHDARIANLESWRWKIAGGLALIAFVIPVVVKVLF